MVINFVSHFFNFSPNIFRIDKFFFNKVQLNDDLGWIIEDTTETHLYSLAKLNSDYTFYESSMFNNVGYNSIFYFASFYMKKSFQLNKRSFMKIQDLAAVVGGFMKFVLFIGRIVSVTYNNISYDNFLFSQLYDFYHEEVSNIKSQVNNILEEKESKSNINPKKRDFIKILNHPTTQKLNANPKTYQTEMKNINFGAKFVIKKFTGCSNDKQKNIYTILHNNLLLKKDALFYLQNISLIDKMKEILFNKNQALSFNFLKLPNAAEEKQLQEIEDQTNKKNERNYEQVLKYFSEKSQNNQLDAIDIKILTHLGSEMPVIKQ